MEEKKLYKYTIETYTGTHKRAATDDEVYVLIYGDKGQTQTEIVLNNLMKNDFEKGHVDSFKVSLDVDLGELWLVEIWKLGFNDWFLEKVVISRNKQKWVFPANRWIEDRRAELREGTSVLIQNEKDQLRVQYRKDELEQNRGRYQWKIVPGIASYNRSNYGDLTREERYPLERLHDIHFRKGVVGFNLGLEKFIGKHKPFKSIADLNKVYRIIKIPTVSKDWDSDFRFGQQRIQGTHPVSLKRVTSFPVDDFPVTTEMIKPLLRKDSTLEDEVKANRVYLIDYTMLEPFTREEHRKPGRYFCAPRCLLYVNADNLLIPIAIILFPKYDADCNPIFTPLCAEPDWILAKLFFGTADFWTHQVGHHLGALHLATEPIVVATHRQLPSVHPVFKLLQPHMKHQVTINTRARELLISPSGVVIHLAPYKFESNVKLLSTFYKQWRYDHMSFPVMLKERGITEDPADLPGYFYRDDGILLWNAMSKFVTELIDGFYSSDEEVVKDTELQAWAKEITEVGYSGEDKGFPSKIESKKSLVDVLTIYIWIVTAQHSVVNFYQFSCFGYIPNNPSALSIPAPGQDGKKWVMGTITMEEVCKALPNKDLTVSQMNITYLLSQYMAFDQFLGSYPETLFTENHFFNCVKKYAAVLEEIGKKIEERGEWDHFHPKKITNSIAI